MNSRFLVTEWYNPLLAERRYRAVRHPHFLYSTIVQLFFPIEDEYGIKFVESIELYVNESCGVKIILYRETKTVLSLPAYPHGYNYEVTCIFHLSDYYI